MSEMPSAQRCAHPEGSDGNEENHIISMMSSLLAVTPGIVQLPVVERKKSVNSGHCC